MLIIGIMVMLKIKKFKLVKVLAIGILIILCTYTLKNTCYYYTEAKVTVIDKDNTEFSITVPNHKDRYEHLYSYFTIAENFEELANRIKNEYENVIVNDDYIQIISNNNSFVIAKIEESKFLWKTRYEYSLTCDYIELPDLKKENTKVRLVFPRSYIPEGTWIHNNMPINCDINTLKQYYQNMSNVILEKDSILVDGIRITITNNQVNFSYITVY